MAEQPGLTWNEDTQAWDIDPTTWDELAEQEIDPEVKLILDCVDAIEGYKEKAGEGWVEGWNRVRHYLNNRYAL